MRLASAAAIAAFAFLVMPTAAAAQPGAPPPPPPGGGQYGGGYYLPPPPPTDRQGLTLGFGVGLGGMDSESGSSECLDCRYDPIALAFDFHIGGMVNPQLAILGEVWVTSQTLDEDGFNWVSQTMLMGAIQYWLNPQFWLKGGLGIASLSYQYDDGYYYGDDTVDGGMAIMGAAGYELLHSPWFAVDLQLRLGVGGYDGIDDRVSSGILGVGFNWY